MTIKDITIEDSTVLDMTNDDARKKIDQIKSRNIIKKGVGARTKSEREYLAANSYTYAEPSTLKKRYVNPELPTICLVYQRISMLVDDSMSVTFDRQDMEIAKLANADGVNLKKAVALQDADISGFHRKQRPDVDALIKFVDDFKGANPISLYIYDLDRFTRNEDVANIVFPILKRQSVTLRVATLPTLNLTDDFSAIILPILIQLAQAESKKTQSRTTGGHEVRAKKGAWRNSVAPFGMAVGKKLIDGTERSILIPGANAGIVKEIFSRIAQGDSINDVVRYLNNENIPAPGSSSIWRDTTVKFILLNPHYAGFTRYNSKKQFKKYDVESQIIKDADGNYFITHESIIAPEDFFIVLSILRSKHKPLGKNKNVHLLSGILYCADCGAKLYGNKGTVSSYRCPDATRDSKLVANSISSAGIDEVIKRFAKEIIANPELLEVISTKKVVNLEEEEEARQLILSEIAELEGMIANEKRPSILMGYKAGLTDATSRLEQYNSNKVTNIKFASKALASADVFEEMWTAKNKTAIIMALKTIIERIDVEPLGDRKKLNTTLLNKKGWLFDYTRVSITWANGTTIKLSEEFDKANEVLYK